jgi:hydrogenase expression/formation protein HypD
MKYVDEFRVGRIAKGIAATIGAEVRPDRRYHLMEFCGGHTHAISRYGIEDMLPESLRLIHGPGCPVCVLPVGRIDAAIHLARQEGVILCTYGDLLRVPGSKRRSLLKAKAEGADVRMVYSPLDAVTIARDTPGREVVFLAIGFETTTPPTAVALCRARDLGLRNFSVFCNHVLTPAAMRTILDSPQADARGRVALDGLIGPAHVSTVIGSAPYEVFAENDRMPVVIAGFEPLDVLQAILMLVRQINDGRAAVENQFTRAVTRAGNAKAQALVAAVFEVRRSFEWRGLGHIPQSALRLGPAFAAWDAEVRFAVPGDSVPDIAACDCGAILRGLRKPADCRLFGTACTPETPMGSCMVSAEGACAAHWTYGRFRDTARRQQAVAAS